MNEPQKSDVPDVLTLPDDADPTETSDWLDSLDAVLRFQGPERAAFLLRRLIDRAARNGIPLSGGVTTPFCNTIPVSREKRMPGDLFMERRIRSLIRWNALAMVMRANKKYEGLGGHIATFSSAATLYDVEPQNG